MNEFALKQSVKKKNLLLTFFVLFSLFISENVFAQNQRAKSYVQVAWNKQRDLIGIITSVYHYSFGPKSVHGFFEYCKFEASADNVNYYKLMDIHTERQIKSKYTTVYLKNKLDRANIVFKRNVVSPAIGARWPDYLRLNMRVEVPNIEEIAVIALGWQVNKDHRDVRFIRISGNWRVDDPSYSVSFNKVVYDLNRPDQSVLKSNTPDINTKVCNSDTVKVFKESEAIVVKGADPGANIKVYNTSGVEIRSVISNNDVVKIELPAKQIYIVHTGISRYKVAF